MNTQALVNFRYGGHATFAVRYGWFAKGLERVRVTGGFTPNAETADDLGLGSKMVDSLAFWLDATGLVDADAKTRGGARSLSEAGRLIVRHDRFLELPVTWWFLHLALCRRPGTVWSWFFNDFSERIFDRAACAQAFERHTRGAAVRPVTEQAATKDVACLLNAYAARPGVDVVSPDDVGACPFRELGLIVRHDAINRFERVRNPIALPPEAFLACVSLLAQDTGRAALSLRELANLRCGPGRIFCAGLPAIESLVDVTTKERGQWDARVVSLVGEHHLEVRPRSLTRWLDDAYARVGGRA